MIFTVQHPVRDSTTEQSPLERVNSYCAMNSCKHAEANEYSLTYNKYVLVCAYICKAINWYNMEICFNIPLSVEDGSNVKNLYTLLLFNKSNTISLIC